MSLAFGPAVIAIPGPSPVPDRVLRAAHRASPDIYGEDLAALNLSVNRRLKQLAGTRAHVACYIGNGHTGWEAAAANMFQPGDKALLLAFGHFGRSWAAHLQAMGVEVEVQDSGANPPDLMRLAARLAEDRAHQIRAVLVCQTDTATSITADIPGLRAAMGDHPALLAVDAIASLGCAPMKMDEWGVDVLIAASQKGLMCLPGTCFVWISERARDRGPTRLTTPVWDWHLRTDVEQLWQFWGGTPPVQQLFALDEALTMIVEEEGLDAVWARHRVLAKAIWAATDAWGTGNGAIRLSVPDPSHRAVSVTAMVMPQATALRAWTAGKAGVTLGIGLGAEDPDHALRIGHMGYCNAAMILATLGAIEAGLTALSIPHGPGAMEAAARVIAEHA